MTKYVELLKHPNWQKKRLEILEAAGFECSNCGDKDRMLAVHHRHYIKGNKPWDYPKEWLVCLCEECHKEAHKQKAMLLNAIADLESSDYEFVRGFIYGWKHQESGDPDDTKTENLRYSIDSYEVAHGFSVGLMAWWPRTHMGYIQAEDVISTQNKGFVTPTEIDLLISRKARKRHT